MKKFYSAFLLLSLLPVFLVGQQVENPGFEQWEPITGSLYEPVDWNTIKTADDPFIASVAPVTYEQSTDARSGEYSLKLYNVLAFGLVATGAICNGRFHAEFDLDKAYSYSDTTDAQWHTPITTRPDSLSGWFKYFPQGTDRAQFKVILHVGECKLPENGTQGNWIAQAYFRTQPGETTENWTRFAVPFEYFSDNSPNYMLIVINSGDSTAATEGSYLLVDDLELIYGSSGIDDPYQYTSFISVHQGYLMVSLPGEADYLGRWFQLTDMAGQQVMTVQLDSRQINLPASLNPGAYVAVMQGKSGRYTQKIMIR